MTVSTPTVAPEATTSGAAPSAEPTPSPLVRSPYAAQQALARMSQPDYPQWLAHIRPAAGCTRPIRLAGTITTLDTGTGRLLSHVDTADMPDGVIYKPCGNRRASACPSCSHRYQRDAYQIIRSLLVGGNGVPETVSAHPAVFGTFTAPSFGEVHTRVLKRHTCQDRRRCDCRPEPCHARRKHTVCPHGTPLVCFARHDATDPRLGTPLCLDCYHHDAQVVWNVQAGELWRRTTIAINRHLCRTARRLGLPAGCIRLSFGKAAEFQSRGVVHFHAIIRLDGVDPIDPTAVVPPPSGLDTVDLVDAVEHAARVTAFTTDPHPAHPTGWRIEWGAQLDLRVIAVAATGQVTDGVVAAYLAKYATKSTEATGFVSGRLTEDTVNLYADPDGTHTERLIEACWILGAPKDWGRLRRSAHMLGFAGHFLTKSRRHRVTFQLLRDRRIVYRRTATAGPEVESQAPNQQTTLVVNFLQFVGAGWHTTGDALLANTSATLARAYSPTHTQPTAPRTEQLDRQAELDGRPRKRGGP